VGEPREVVRAYLKALEQTDLDALDQLVAENVVVYTPNGDAFDNRPSGRRGRHSP
jgi:ketosteroid isomerase-like protein